MYSKYVFVPLPHGSYRRFGEAMHPGPIVRMPGDGHCLYHAIAWWVGGTAHAVRTRLANISEQHWYSFMPPGSGQILLQYQAETADRTQWGGALQIAAAAAIFQTSFSVHSPFGVHTIGTGFPCHLWYSAEPVGHYDVWTDEEPPSQPVSVPVSAAPTTAPRLPPPPMALPPCPTWVPRVRTFVPRLGGLSPHLITTVNVGVVLRSFMLCNSPAWCFYSKSIAN